MIASSRTTPEKKEGAPEKATTVPAASERTILETGKMKKKNKVLMNG